MVREQASCVGLKSVHAATIIAQIGVVREQASCVGLKLRLTGTVAQEKLRGEGASILCRIEILQMLTGRHLVLACGEGASILCRIEILNDETP